MDKSLRDSEAIKFFTGCFPEFENKLNGEAESEFHSLRKDAINKLNEAVFPTMKHEEWKYTNINEILKGNFKPAKLVKAVKVENEFIDKNKFTGFNTLNLVFVNGIFNSELSDAAELPKGVVLKNMATALKEDTELVKKYFNKLNGPENAFNTLNEAYSTDGIFLYVPAGKVVEPVIQLMFISGGEEKVLAAPHNVFIVEENAQARVITNYVGLGQQPYFNNIVTEVSVSANGILDIYKIQNEKADSYHIERLDAKQEKQSVFSHYNMTFGGQLTRNDINAEMNDEFIETNLFGIYLGNDKRHVDNHTFVNHAKPNCESNELYKGILDNNSRGVFNGKILVKQDAQKTNAYQSNKTILLTPTARVDTKPQLEIYADDVKCSHGATIGHLDDTAYFYLRSRGVPSDLAQSMLIRAFAEDVIAKVKIEELRDELNHMIFENLSRVEIK